MPWNCEGSDWEGRALLEVKLVHTEQHQEVRQGGATATCFPFPEDGI